MAPKLLLLARRTSSTPLVTLAKSEVSATAALRFVRSLPSSTGGRRSLFVLPSGRGLRTAARMRHGAVRFSGTHRLKVLQPLLPGAKTLRVWFEGQGRDDLVHMGLETFAMLEHGLERGLARPPAETANTRQVKLGT